MNEKMVELLGKDFKARSLNEFLTSSEAEQQDLAKFKGLAKEEVFEKLISKQKWRYHHDLEELKSEKLYRAYAERVESMFDTVDTVLNDIQTHELQAADFGAAEGFVSFRYRNRFSGIDAFELNEDQIERIQLLCQIFGTENLRLFKLDFEQVGWSQVLPRQYDLVFALGLVYHMENPALFCRNLYEATGRIAIVESDTPQFSEPNRFRGNGVVYLNKDQVTLRPGVIRKLVEFRPDRMALAQMLLAAGFESVEALPPSKTIPCRYFESGEKTIFLCKK